MIGCSYQALEFSFPVPIEPLWSKQVERWYQMDAPSYGLCQLWTEFPTTERPEALVLASPGGCNSADRQFVVQQATSPAKFVYTLPNIRASALLQLMNWQGPMLCVQDGTQTVVSALREACLLNAQYSSLWICGVWQERLAFRLQIGGTGSLSLTRQGAGGALATDVELLDWLHSPRRDALGIGAGLALQIGDPA
jgi:hypothetical protein